MSLACASGADTHPRSWVSPDLFSAGPRTWPFGGLRPHAYDLIMIDPPWHMEMYSEAGEGRSPQAHYDTMTLDDIAALPVRDLARENCRLWMWATTPLLPRQIEILAAWGFRYSTSAVWAKRTVHGKRHFGTGYGGFRNEHEILLVGTRGAPGEPADKSVRSIFEGKVREHSRKPEIVYELAARMYPTAVKCDVFSRQSRPGWEAFGNEAGKFDESLVGASDAHKHPRRATAPDGASNGESTL